MNKTSSRLYNPNGGIYYDLLFRSLYCLLTVAWLYSSEHGVKVLPAEKERLAFVARPHMEGLA